MIYVTGDLHGDARRFKQDPAKRMKKDDVLIVCGDFGFIWDGSPQEQHTLKTLAKLPFTLLFIEGTHDNLDLLEAYKETDYCGGRARHIVGNVWHLKRGCVFEIAGKRIFAFGGGESGDREDRVPGVSWWARELPSDEEVSDAREALRRVDDQVDYIITHECSITIKGFIDFDNTHITHLNGFFERVGEFCAFKYWLFGCYHLDKRLSGSYTAVFKNVIPLE